MPGHFSNCVATLLGASFLFVAIPAGGQGRPVGGPATVPANYKGATTTASYTPLPIVGPGGVATTQPAIHVGPISDPLRRDYRLNAFYTKAVTIDGIPIIGSDKVSDFAFLECAYTLDHMLMNSPRAVKDALIASRVRMGIISVVEYTMDIPENQTRQNMVAAGCVSGPPLARAGRACRWRLVPRRICSIFAAIRTPRRTSRSTNSPTPWPAPCAAADPAWYKNLQDIYKQAMSEGLFASSYSATNEQEYWAEGAQAWFDCASPAKDPTVHSGIWHRDQLKRVRSSPRKAFKRYLWRRSMALCQNQRPEPACRRCNFHPNTRRSGASDGLGSCPFAGVQFQ